MKLLVINGPNINMLGIREPEIYGKITYDQFCRDLRESARELGLELEIYQSNHEGDLIDRIQAAYGNTDGIVINPGGYTHTSIALLDALLAVGIPTVEVHISAIDAREDFRRISYVSKACIKTISGHGLAGYFEALQLLAEGEVR